MLVMAHGIVGRTDLPIPEWLFGWAAAVVLVASFVALAVLWPQPRLQDGGSRPLPAGLSRALDNRVVEGVCGAVGVGLLLLVLYSGLNGAQAVTANFAPNFVFVVFWVGLVPDSILLGDVFRALNPWRALGRTVAWIAQTAAREPLPAPLAYPDRLGYLRRVQRGRFVCGPTASSSCAAAIQATGPTPGCASVRRRPSMAGARSSSNYLGAHSADRPVPAFLRGGCRVVRATAAGRPR